MEECFNCSSLLVKHLNKNTLLPAIFHVAVEYNANVEASLILHGQI